YSVGGEVENAGPGGFGLGAVFAGPGADINFAPRRSVQPPQLFHFLFGFGQWIELAAAQRERRALDRLPSDGRVAEREQGGRRGVIPSLLPLRLHFAQDRQRRGKRNGAPFDHVAVIVGEQRLERQFPELVVGHDDEIGFAAKLRLRRF